METNPENSVVADATFGALIRAVVQQADLTFRLRSYYERFLSSTTVTKIPFAVAILTGNV